MNTHHKTVVIQDLREPIFTLKQPKNMFIVTYSEINQRESEHRYINWPFASFFLNYQLLIFVNHVNSLQKLNLKISKHDNFTSSTKEVTP